MYQANYGFTASGEHNPNVNVTAENDSAATAESAKKGEKESSAAGTLVFIELCFDFIFPLYFSFHPTSFL